MAADVARTEASLIAVYKKALIDKCIEIGALKPEQVVLLDQYPEVDQINALSECAKSKPAAVAASVVATPAPVIEAPAEVTPAPRVVKSHRVIAAAPADAAVDATVADPRHTGVVPFVGGVALGALLEKAAHHHHRDTVGPPGALEPGRCSTDDARRSAKT